MSFESLTNRGEYLSSHYLSEILPATLKKGLLAWWATDERAGRDTPRTGIRKLRRAYLEVKAQLVDLDDETQRYHQLREFHGEVLRALGFAPVPQKLEVERAGHEHLITVAHAEPGVVAIDCGWATDPDAATDPDGAGRLLHPVELEARERIESGFKLASHLFAADEQPPRYVLILNGGVLTLADRTSWGEGRYLAVSLDVAFSRNDARPAGELDVIAALFGSDSLLPPAEGGTEPLAELVAGSRQHAAGVSTELREGLRLSVEFIANEVLDRIRQAGIQPERVMDPAELGKRLSREALRYLYRVLFLLYAEARPELGVLPVDHPEYIEGYSLARLGDLVARNLGGESSRNGFHLYESLDLLFRMVNEGHRNEGERGTSEGEGIRFEPMRSDLFLPASITLIGHVPHPEDDPEDPAARTIDTRLRNSTLHTVLRLLMLTKGKKRERGGFISYAQLGINQLGAVYEGLMSYTGFIAAEELYEVAKGGEPKDGSWMIPASKVNDYPDEVFVTKVHEETSERSRVRYPAGSFVYRLAGRDRQTSASYYTPQSLTEVTVQLALKYRLDQDGTTTEARELLDWSICEPALGSGAFLNEAINQVAAEYLRRRQVELGSSLDPEQYAIELQKVKAYIALHNCYGVDLNRTAVELAEVSLWLNVMHSGLRAPWFGLHLRRGNSLIGAGRKFYKPAQLPDKQWLTTAPTDHHLREETPLPDGAILHFLLPAKGWGAVAGEREARELAPEETAKLAAWRRAIQKVPAAKGKKSQVQRLQALTRRAEKLWDLVRQRLEISENEIRRDIDVWGGVDLPAVEGAVTREKILADLEAPGAPYWRLKTMMDVWCALWFWPLDKAALLDGSAEEYASGQNSVARIEEQPVYEEAQPLEVWEHGMLFDLGEPEQLKLALNKPRKQTGTRKATVLEKLAQKVALTGLDDWLEFAEALLGRADIPADSLVSQFSSLDGLESYEDQLPGLTGMDEPHRLAERFPWLLAAEEIADRQGFFHWELDFAQAFARGGFDLQAGNPPWVRPEWDEDGVLAEREPWFKIAHDADIAEKRSRKAAILMEFASTSSYLAELAINTAGGAFLGSGVAYPLLAGTQPDLYRAFMCQVWGHLSSLGTAALVHPDTHFVGAREGRLRAAAYRHLRVHGGFVNAANWAFAVPIGRNIEFGVHAYGSEQDVAFLHLSKLYGATVLSDSLAHDGTGSAPGQKFNGTWDLRPHGSRVIHVDLELLSEWRRFRDDTVTPIKETPLLSPITSHEASAIEALANYGRRLASMEPMSTSGFHEKGAKQKGLIRAQAGRPKSMDEVIFQGSHLSVSTPFAKQPGESFSGGKDWHSYDLTNLPVDSIPRTKYARACGIHQYQAAQDIWNGRPYTEFYRLAWRKMIDSKAMERSLYSALIPPGVAHIDGLYSLRLSDNITTVLNAGFWAALPMDYLVRISGRANLHAAEAQAMPAADLENPLATALAVRALRLNCLTRAYADLWAELYDGNWLDEEWAVSWTGVAPLGEVGPVWGQGTPLRTERVRRAALVEIDALVSVWLGIEAEELVALYKSRYPILADREAEMWFDSAGRKIAADSYTFGFGQTKEDYVQLMAHLEDPDKVAPPAGYEAPFCKADREAEMRQAHAVFSARLQAAKDAGWSES